MTDVPMRAGDPALRALTREIVDAPDPQIMRIVAIIDAMARRGSADQLIAPLRAHLRTLRPPRPLRFQRLLFFPLDKLIVPAARWNPEQHTLPRTALTPMAHYVRQAIGPEAEVIEAAIAGKTTADTALIARLGRTLWPKAARILAAAATPDIWQTTDLSDVINPALVALTAVLLELAAPLDAMAADMVAGLSPARPEMIALMLSKTTLVNPAAVPMLLELMLIQLPEAATSVQTKYLGSDAVRIQVMLDQVAERLLRELDDERVIAERIDHAPLADAGHAVSRIMILLNQFRDGAPNPRQRARMQSIRHRLDAACRARFAAGLQDDVLMPLHLLDNAPDPAAIQALESAARSLRVLEIEARSLGSGSSYDLLLTKATQAVTADILRDKLTRVDQIRLVELLGGRDAALEYLQAVG